MPLDAYLHRLLDDWQIIRPHARISVTLQGEQPAPLIAADRTLEQAILNLLDNAADANGASREACTFPPAGTPTVVGSKSSTAAPGCMRSAALRLGEAFFSTKTATGTGQAASASGCFSATPPSSASVARSNCSIVMTRQVAPAPASPCR
jgi:hypothetical protein